MNFIFHGDLLASVFNWIRMCMRVKIVHVHTNVRLDFYVLLTVHPCIIL